MPARKSAAKTPSRTAKKAASSAPFVSTDEAIANLVESNGDRASKRQETKVVDTYLTALSNRRVGPGRRVTTESVGKQLERIDERVDATTGVERLVLLQRRQELTAKLLELELDTNFDDLEAEFVAHAAAYGNRKNITYNAWREYGVPAGVLRRAGIERE